MILGCTSRSTSRVAHVRRASCTVMIRGHPALRQLAVNARLNVRGSHRGPVRPGEDQVGPAGQRPTRLPAAFLLCTLALPRSGQRRDTDVRQGQTGVGRLGFGLSA